MPDLLIELFSEEIPARMQPRARADLQRRITEGLRAGGLSLVSATAFSTPRRLALAVEGLAAESPARHESRKGPRVDAPEAAIEGFLRSTGLTRAELRVKDDKKGQYYSAQISHPGRPADDIVAEVLEGAIRDFPWPKSMRWGSGSLRWVRPLHAILCILTDHDGARVVPLEVDGIAAGDTTRGHRFMAPDPVRVTGHDDYAAKLRRAHVLLDPEARAEHIRAEAATLTFARGLELVEDAGLLEEVTGMVEWPVVLMGEIGGEFRHLPPEVLQTSMREHQKFFSVRDPAAGQITHFVTVANRETEDGGATILAGNQRVLAARLADAAFFWDNDLRVVREAGLAGMAEGLAQVTFHARLGSQADRVARIAALAREIAPLVGADPELADQAARVAKADLQSAMVGEFPELQGVMGRYYAEAEGLDPAVAEACALHYKPLGPGDDVPTAPVSVAVALADKIDTLAGFWAIDEKPTGSKDPYALRRAGLGIIRLVLRFAGTIKLSELLVRSTAMHIRTAVGRFDTRELSWTEITNLLGALQSETSGANAWIAATSELRAEAPEKERLDAALGSSGVIDAFEHINETFVGLRSVGSAEQNLLAFLHERLKVHLRDEGIRHDVIDACLAMPGADDLALLVRRAEALGDLLKTDDGENLLQGFKRANNILTQAEEADGVEYSFGPDPKLAETGAEAELFNALDAAQAEIEPAMAAEDFAAAMRAMAGLRAPIDAFFEAVQINTDNQTVRRNRLNLLHRIREICLQVADLRRVEG